MKGSGLIGIGIGLLLIAHCCNSPTAPAPTPSPTPLPAAVAHRAGVQMLSTRSLHFLMELEGKLVFLDNPPTMALKRAEGDVVRPDQVRAIVKISSFGLISELGIIGIGDDQYLTNPVSQEWEKLPPGVGWYFDPALIFDPDHGIEAILEDSEWSFGNEESIDGQSCYDLNGKLPGERIAPLASGMIGAGRVEVDIWVGQVDATVRRVQIIELESDPENPTQWLLEFSSFDEVDAIQPPPVQ